MKRSILKSLWCVLLVGLAGCEMPGMVPPGHPLPPAPPTPSPTPLPPLRLPQDEAPHNVLNEWWYYTGHLQGKDASGHTHTYGFELTFFQFLRGDLAPVYVGHYAVSDLTASHYQSASHTASEPNTVIPNGASTTGFHLAIDDWTMQGLNGHDQLHAAMPDYTIQLSLQSAKPVPVLQNGNGILQRGETGFSYYYSRTRMNVTGTVTDHATPITVTGIAWMDHQWGNFILGNGESWDWFSIQLDNDTEYMVFFLTLPTTTGATRLAGATLVRPDGSTTTFTTGLAEANQGSWTSPTTHIDYPMGWDVLLPGVQFTALPDMQNQEFTTQDPSGQSYQSYWEGASHVTARIGGQSITGQAYVELTGYAKQP